MKKAIATEQVFNALGQRIGVKYHYFGGTSREVVTRRTAEQVTNRLKEVMNNLKEREK